MSVMSLVTAILLGLLQAEVHCKGKEECPPQLSDINFSPKGNFKEQARNKKTKEWKILCYIHKEDNKTSL